MLLSLQDMGDRFYVASLKISIKFRLNEPAQHIVILFQSWSVLVIKIKINFYFFFQFCVSESQKLPPSLLQ